MTLLQETGYILASDQSTNLLMDRLDNWNQIYHEVRKTSSMISGFDRSFSLGLSLLKDRLDKTVKRRVLTEIKDLRDTLLHDEISVQDVSSKIDQLSILLSRSNTDWKVISPNPNWQEFVTNCYLRTFEQEKRNQANTSI